jgi:hypothetical protein
MTRTPDATKASEIAKFMSRVIPWPATGAPGVINLHWRVKGADGSNQFWVGKPTQKIDEFMRLLSWAKSKPRITDIYYCLSLQGHFERNKNGASRVTRSIADALLLRSIWLDIDIKEPPKGYVTLHEALDALAEFVKVVKIPGPSALIGSGGGVHVYWISDEPLTQDAWRPYAEGLKAAAIQHGLRCDAGVTSDAARILRVPGTFNYKSDPPRPVKLLGIQETDYDFSTALSVLPPLAVQSSSRSVVSSDGAFAGKSPAAAFASLPKESLAEGLEREDRPLDWAPLVKECAFFRNAYVTGGKDYDQPMWNLSTLMATFLENGHALAHRMGNKHQGYSKDSTDALWDRKTNERKSRHLGWPSCNAIQSAGCAACATCKHFGKIKSPLNLAFTTAQTDQKTVVNQAKGGEINPVSALMTLRGQGADIKTLLAAMNETYAVVRYGNDILVANIIGNDISCMNEQSFHKMFANLEFSYSKEIARNLRKMKERIEHIGNNIISMPVEDFHEMFADLVVINADQKKVSRRWFNWEGRRYYLGRGVVFEPGGPLEIPKDLLNLWRGFGIEPKRGDWSLLRNHILNVVCSGHKELFDYLIKWMAYAVQHPNEPIGVAVAFRGAQGAGKGIVARTFGKFFGKHFAHIANGDQLTGRFNASLGTSCAVFLDEALWAGDKKGEGVLKALITEPKLQLEAKFRDPIMVDNRLRIIVASNNDWIAPVGMGDRRWFILDVANTYAGTEHQKYWAALYAEIDTGGAAAIFHDLLAMDLRGFDVRAVPHTAAKAQQQAHSLAGTEAWLYHVLQEGAIGCERWQNTGLTVSTDDAYLCFEDYSKRQRDWRPDRKDLWSKKMRAMLGPCVEDIRQTTAGERVRSFKFAPLAKCRRQFEAHARAPNIEWEPENDPKLDPGVTVVRQTTEDVGELTELDVPLDAPELEWEPTDEPDKVD